MKKALFFTFIALITIHFAKAQDIVNLRLDTKWEGLRGCVSSMDEDILLRSDDFREDWPTRKWFRDDMRKFLSEENGRVLNFNPAGRLLNITYTYQGKAGKKTSCTYASNGLLSSFLGEGYKVEAKYSAGGTVDMDIYTESKRYSTLKDITHDELSRVPYYTTYPFDMKCTQKLSSSGLILRSEYHYVDNVTLRICEYSYNHNDQIVSEKIKDYTKSPTKPQVTNVTYSYDGNDFLVRKTVKSPAADDVYDYVNNEHGDCVKLTITRAYEKHVYTYEYDYDDQDNWTIRLQYLDGKFDRAYLRTFTYHKKAAKDAQVSIASDDNAMIVAQQKENDRAISFAKSKLETEKKAAKDAKTSEAIAEQEAQAAEARAAEAVKAAKEARKKADQAAKAAKTAQSRADKAAKDADKTRKKADSQMKSTKSKADKHPSAQPQEKAEPKAKEVKKNDTKADSKKDAKKSEPKAKSDTKKKSEPKADSKKDSKKSEPKVKDEKKKSEPKADSKKVAKKSEPKVKDDKKKSEPKADKKKDKKSSTPKPQEIDGKKTKKAKK